MQPVQWGRLSMLDSERRLLANALLDVSNERFVLLSEACIPLFNFTTVYSYLTNSRHSYVHSFDDPGANGRGRYPRRMRPHVKLSSWRKGSQWFELDRAMAQDIVAESNYYGLFAKYCKPTCYVDEHYLSTLVALKFGGRSANRSLTWVDWSRGGPHPMRFGRREVTIEVLNKMRSGEGKRCGYNGGSTDICFLFARKFLPNALDRLLRFAPKVLGY
ncbi:uncharacterized protein LOC18432185 [Amborella trichopoda]|nr:uncharacterized protein LOC18432185 [Amborella trichopoda]|eukprot:XP_006842358.2 uncharacterized protein LOC18432185 [Amborella trichopoda]